MQVLKIKDNKLNELGKYGFIKTPYGYEKCYIKISYAVSHDKVIHKLKDMTYYTDELKITKQDIKRLGIADIVELVEV